MCNGREPGLRALTEQLDRAIARCQESETRASGLAEALDAATAELRDREARTKQVLNTANDAFLTADIAGRVTDWNTAAEALFGVSADAALGQTVDQFLLPVSGEPDPTNPLSDVLAACGQNSRGEMVAVCEDGRRLPVEVSISLMVDEDRFVFNAFVHDISDRQDMMRRLMQSQKLESIGQLAADIAHEINTPTQYVGDNVEFLRDGFSDLLEVLDAAVELRDVLHAGAADGSDLPEPVAAKLAELERVERDADVAFLRDEVPAAITQAAEGVQRVATIVRSMKSFSHPGGSGASGAAMSSIDLNDAVSNTLTVCRSEWKYVAEMHMEFADGLPVVSCFPGELNQVVLNLVVNAAQALAEQGKGEGQGLGNITVRTRRDGPGHVCIDITDDAGGIPAHVQPRIFDPFFTTKGVGQGTGQGLAIAHRVVTEQHAGTLDFTTTAGEGTTFTIRLPIKPGVASEDAAASAGATQASGAAA
ncbi:MAG: ATP-binding protein [Planctomycetota bacterium]